MGVLRDSGDEDSYAPKTLELPGDAKVERLLPPLDVAGLCVGSRPAGTRAAGPRTTVPHLPSDSNSYSPVRLCAGAAISPERTGPPLGCPDPGSPALSLEATVRYALENNPQLAALRQQHGIAAAVVVIAKTYPFNPIYQSNVLYAKGNEPGAVTNSVPETHQLTLEVQLFHQQRYRQQAAFAALTRTDWEIASQELAFSINAIRTFDTVLYRQGSSTIRDIQTKLDEEMPDRPGFSLEFGGLYQQQQESFRNLTFVLAMAVLLVFLVLLLEFRSFLAPLAIVWGSLLSLIGVALALWLTDTSLNIISFLGALIGLGIVAKNGILMLDRVEHLRAAGMPLEEALVQSGRRRLRPVLMTSLAAALGMLPLAYGVGSGADMLKPLAIAVMGALAISVLLSLVATPVMYFLLMRCFGGVAATAAIVRAPVGAQVGKGDHSIH